MRVVMLAFGSWGDVRPYVVLGQALQNAGYDVLFLAAKDYCEWVEEHGIPFVELSVDLQALMDTVMNADIGSGKGLFESIRWFNQKISPAMVELGQGVADVVQTGDVFICMEVMHHLVHGIIEAYNLRLIKVSMFPMIPSSEFALFNIPDAPAWMPARGLYNRVSGQFLRRMTWFLVGTRGNQLRKDYLNLPKRSWRDHRKALDAAPHILPVSRHVLTPPNDWPAPVRVTGYLFDDEPEWDPPQDLLDFLDSGEKPVYIGFGSMPQTDPVWTTRVLVDAVQQAGQRAVILSGWAGLGDEDLPDSIFLLKYAPHSWLFPRMKAVVHHGGAGTIAAGLRAGVPTIVVPVLGDQPFWGRRVHELGVGPMHIPRSKLSVDRLAAAIRQAATDTAMQTRAAELGQKITAEDGPAEAVQAIKTILA